MLPNPTACRHAFAVFVRRFHRGALVGRWLASLAFALVVALPAFAQTTGEITGRVLNVGTGRYLNNARVTIDGTSRETFTNEFGEYRFNGVPAGTVQIRASYTGLDVKTESVTVTAGSAVKADFNLTSAERYGAASQDDKVYQLDTFVVQSNREYEGDALATNEQRYAPNVKVVMASDSFGAINEGNPGEFLKYLPGVTVDYVAADVRTVSVRGFAANFSNIYWDGMRMTSSASGSSSRVFEFEQVSINNTSRTEVVKVPTPDIPADSLGGSVNFISKNAFERKGAQFNYRTYLNMNSENTEVFKKTPGPKSNKSSYKVLPNFDFDYTLPVNDRFGLVITGLNSNQHVEQHRWQPTWNFAQGGATPTNPYLQQWQIQDGPKTTTRASIGIKADWKVTRNQTLSAAVQDNYYKTFFGNRNLSFNMGTSTVATSGTNSVPLSYGPDFVQAASGRGSITQGSSHRDKLGNTAAGNLLWKWEPENWVIDAGASMAKSRTWYRALGRGHFSNVGTTLQGVRNLRADNVPLPGMSIVARDASDNAIDFYDLDNYRLGTLRDDPVDGIAKMRSLRLNAERFFDTKIPFSVKVGGEIREETRDNRRYQNDYSYLGADGVANTADDSAGPFLDTNYNGVDPYFGFHPIQWVDPYRLAAEFAANPSRFRLGTGTNQTGVQAETFRINNSERIMETVTAGYVQLEGKLLQNKLRFVTGVRYELTEDSGQGRLFNPDAVWQRNSDGSYYDSDPATAGVQRVRRADAGTVGSMEELRLTRVERAYHANRDYDGYYPSLHLSYNITDNFIARFAYAKTFGRPDYANIIPSTDINEDDNDPNAIGTISIRNTALKPWTANNYDLSLEYYFQKGGYVSAGVFKKTLADFWQSKTGVLDAALASELGLDDRYLGWNVTTTINGGAAEISGMEFGFVRPLNFSFLPAFAKDFQIRANGTMLHLTGEKAPDFSGFISKAGNFSISYSHKPWAVNLNLNYRGRQRNAKQTGGQYGSTGGFYEYYRPRFNIDLSAEYKLSKRLGLFVAARNILNEPQILERYNPNSPGYSQVYRHEEFGINFSAGIKGTF